MISSPSITSAISFASRVYANLVRDQGIPFITHPLCVAELYCSFSKNPSEEGCIVAILHDYLHMVDNPSENYLAETYGKVVLESVRALTKLHVLEKRTKQDSDLKIFWTNILHKDGLVLEVKICDMIHNLSELPLSPNKDKRKQYVQEIRSYFLPEFLTTNKIAVSDQLNQLFLSSLEGTKLITEELL